MAFASFDSNRTSAPMAEINMVPLIDVMLVLLVIFIVTAPLLTNTVKLDLPKADAAATTTKPDKIEFAIDAIGNLYWNNELLSRPDAAKRFAEAAARRQYVSRAMNTGIQFTNAQPASRICSTYHLVAISEPTGR